MISTPSARRKGAPTTLNSNLYETETAKPKVTNMPSSKDYRDDSIYIKYADVEHGPIRKITKHVRPGTSFDGKKRLEILFTDVTILGLSNSNNRHLADHL